MRNIVVPYKAVNTLNQFGYIDDCEGAMKQFYYEYENPDEDCGHWNEEIETIVTKEQMEAIQYKVV